MKFRKRSMGARQILHSGFVQEYWKVALNSGFWAFCKIGCSWRERNLVWQQFPYICPECLEWSASLNLDTQTLECSFQSKFDERNGKRVCAEYWLKKIIIIQEISLNMSMSPVQNFFLTLKDERCSRIKTNNWQQTDRLSDQLIESRGQFEAIGL